jgi:hypothetical protein
MIIFDIEISVSIRCCEKASYAWGCLFNGGSPGDLVEGLLLFLGVAITQSVSENVFSVIDGLRLEFV